MRAAHIRRAVSFPLSGSCARSTGVERITVRKALEILVEEGLVEKKPGLGSFVRAARSGREGRGDTVLFVMGKNQNDIRSNSSAFNARLFFPMEQACRAAGYSLLYAGLEAGEDIADLIERPGIAGVFLVSTLPRSILDTVREKGIPAVLLNHRDDRFVSVLPDNASGAQMAVNALFARGHTRIGHVQGAAGSVNGDERMRAFRAALMENGLTFYPQWNVWGEWTYEGGKRAVAALLSSLPREEYPTALFAASDMMAIGAMDAIREAGLSVPDDISVIGFDDIDMCEFCSPRLTSVGLDPDGMARVSMAQLISRMEQEATAGDFYTIRLPVHMTARASTADRGGKT